MRLRVSRISEILLVNLRHPAWSLLVYGFSAGLPFKVLFAVVGLYLRQLGYDLTTITAFTLLGLFFSLKFLWSPVLEHPRLGARLQRLGNRRASLLLTQSVLIVLFLVLATIDPNSQWSAFVIALVLIAFFSATGDIIIDALRIELMPAEHQGVLSANYLIGYRVGLIAGVSVPLYVVDATASWSLAFVSIALLLLPAIVTTLIIDEPKKQQKKSAVPQRYLVELYTTLCAALGEFKIRYLKYLPWIIGLALMYRFCDLLLGVLAYPFYYDVGYSSIQIANYSGVMGVIVTLVGGLIGGYCLLRYRWRTLLIIGLLLAALSNLAFVALAIYGRADQVFPLAMAIVADNLAGGLATTVFIAWLSSLVNLNFTAIQYALLSSLSTLPGKLIGSGGGWLVDTLRDWVSSNTVSSGMFNFALSAPGQDAPLMTAYALFFLLSTLVALPVWLIIRQLPDQVIHPARRFDP